MSTFRRKWAGESRLRKHVFWFPTTMNDVQNTSTNGTNIDLVGGPFAVIESDPGKRNVFILTRFTMNETRRIHLPHPPSRHTRSRAHRIIRHRTMGNGPPLPARPHLLLHVAQRRTPSNRLWRSCSGKGLVRESAQRRRVCDPCHFERRLELSRRGFGRGVEDVQEGDRAHVACCTLLLSFSYNFK